MAHYMTPTYEPKEKEKKKLTFNTQIKLIQQFVLLICIFMIYVN